MEKEREKKRKRKRKRERKRKEKEKGKTQKLNKHKNCCQKQIFLLFPSSPSSPFLPHSSAQRENSFCLFIIFVENIVRVICFLQFFSLIFNLLCVVFRHRIKLPSFQEIAPQNGAPFPLLLSFLSRFFFFLPLSPLPLSFYFLDSMIVFSFIFFFFLLQIQFMMNGGSF